MSFLCGTAISRVRVPFMADEDQIQALDVAARTIAQIANALIDATVFSLVTLAVVYLMVLTAAGQRPALGGCLRGAAHPVLPLLGWSVPAALMIGGGLLLCLLPGVYVTVVLVLLAPVVAVERREGIGRCFDLFHASSRAGLSRNGTIVAVMVTVSSIGSWLQAPITFAVSSVQVDIGAGDSLLALAISSTVTAVVGILTGPLTVTAYADLRARRERTSTAELAEPLLRRRQRPA